MSDDPLRTAMRKCMMRHPGESVTLTDEEVCALLADQAQGGAEEALAQVTTVAVRNRDATIAALRARAEKAEAERDAALAACAEMRAAAVGVDGRCRLCTASPREHRDSCALVFTRDEVVGGRVVLDGEEEARVQSALELVTSDPEADMLHATTRDAVSDALALLKGKVTTT